MTRTRHYFTLELDRWLPHEKYLALLSCTVDGRSTFDRVQKVNTFLIDVSKIEQVEQLIGRAIRITRVKICKVDADGALEPREGWRVDVCVDASQRLIIVILNGKPQSIPFEYANLVWSLVKASGNIRPREVWRIIENRLQMRPDSLYQDRGNYYAMYYWPVVALKSLGLIEQSGNGPLVLTSLGASRADWKELLDMQPGDCQ